MPTCRTPRLLRPIKEAALALFAAGAPPAVVSHKFQNLVAYSTVVKWYHQWAELKGIPLENRYSPQYRGKRAKVYTPGDDYEAIEANKELIEEVRSELNLDLRHREKVRLEMEAKEKLVRSMDDPEQVLEYEDVEQIIEENR